MLSILQGDCLNVLPTLPAASVQCCVTSPPYWGLRDYGTATWEGGEAGCNHRAPDEAGQTTKPTNGQREHAGRFAGPTCYKCGARRIDSQLGLEATPEEYVANMVKVFREVGRVLRNDGTLWVNMGDSYAGSTSGNTNGSGKSGLKNDGRNEASRQASLGIQAADMATMAIKKEKPPGLKPKDLCGIPWRLAFALQADGWYLRSDIIWSKPNPMPESVTDRPTKAHEYIFLLTKQERYFYDAEAIKEPNQNNGARDAGYLTDATLRPHNGATDGKGLGGYRMGSVENGRNRRTVWTVATQPYSEAHFATFPEDLIKPCIMAGSRLGDTVLDPFGGSGTTGLVAIELGRRAVLIELNPKYAGLIRDRTNVTAGML
jgi:DNA modification methylase